MNVEALFERYGDLQRYVGWTDDDARRVAALGPLLAPHFPALVDDFYAEIGRHHEARRVITGGEAQIERLKQSLTFWLHDLFSGRYDADYVARRWQVGRRHAEIGLDQVYTNMALSRLRRGLLRVMEPFWSSDPQQGLAARGALNTLLDLDLAIIEDAYQAAHVARQQRVERLATLGQVAGGIAHELRNPLNVVMTSVYFLLNARRATPEKTAEHLRRIERQVGVADRVITALSDFSKLPLPELGPVAIEACLRETLEHVALPEGIDVSLECPPDAPPALGDAAQLRIVFANLVRNARDAMPDGGRLELHVVHDGLDVRVAIRDTGVGISPEELPRVTEPLYTTKPRGLGLGLAIARAILDKHGGKLDVQSRPGQGSTFTVCLPAAPV